MWCKVWTEIDPWSVTDNISLSVWSLCPSCFISYFSIFYSTFIFLSSSTTVWSFQLYFMTFISTPLPLQRSPSPLHFFLRSQSSCLGCRRNWLVHPQTLKRALWLVVWSISFKPQIPIGCSLHTPPIMNMGGRSFRRHTGLWSALWLAAQLCRSVRTTAALCPPQPIRASQPELYQYAPPSQCCWELWEKAAVRLVCCWL